MRTASGYFYKWPLREQNDLVNKEANSLHHRTANIGGMAMDTEYEDLQSFLPTSGEPEASIAVYSHLALALYDIKCGRKQSADTVFAEILCELEQFNK